MRLASLSLAALLAAVPAHAFIAWSGNSCDGAQGNTVPCDASCRDFTGRHSFNAQMGGGSCVSMYTAPGCNGARFNFTGIGSQCINVNTGTDIRSFQCFYAGCF
ncbi:hypothetical protein AURDEDRAFT_166540 [Auricularia subglabra TFB-10046 SS5]|nr:hypothetical protein AURDEDRAFT_166540 [Auricularia subglabra TFB-10046 SS5]